MNDLRTTSSLLNEEHLFQLASLEAKARVVADGLLVGRHSSRRFGSSSEFAEHKLYSPGDDLRHMDWKVFGRLDKHYVRRYEEETNLAAFLIVDPSNSMSYAGGAKGRFSVSKFEFAKTCAASIAWLLHHKSDAAGLSIYFDDDKHEELLPSAREDQLRGLIQALENAKPRGKTVLAKQLQYLASKIRRRSLVVVLSDFLDVDEGFLEPLAVLRRRGHDVILLNTLDRDEVEFPFEGVVLFEDLEGEREEQVDAASIKKAYLEEVEKHFSAIEQQAESFDLRFHRMLTDEDLVHQLQIALSLAPSGKSLLQSNRT
ncbi:MAG: DUF58 domain-containing protein [Deltaproteobacteria bacterium]|nr:DUF58 domain-containing protein [Deltaproteobacteria bacterium]